MTAFNMCTFFNNCCCGINNMFMPFNSFSFNNFFSSPPTFNQFNGFTPSFFNFAQQTPLFQMPTMNFTQTSFNWSNVNTGSLWNQASLSFNNNFSFGDTFSSSASTSSVTRLTGPLQSQVAQKALSYVGNVNSDQKGNELFSNGRTNEWCADFASSIIYDIYGSKIPSSFPNAKKHAVSSKSLMQWGKNNNCFLQKPSSGIDKWIAANVKVGDIMILDRGGAKGHTAIVTKVNSDGTFDIVEGNVGGKKHNGGRVWTQKGIKAPSNLLGFVSLDKYSA